MTRIRNKLGVLESDLPNEIIDEAVANVESWIVKRVPNYSDLNTSDKQILENAVVAFVAGNLCNTMPTRIPVREDGAGGKFEMNIDWQKLQEMFTTEGEVYLGSLLIPDFTFGHFILGGPSR